MKTTIDLIEFAELCSQWHGGQSSMMYAVASTGGLSVGTCKPADCETEHEWLQCLLRNLIGEINCCLRFCEQDEDRCLLEDFKKKVDSCIDFDD